MLGGDCNAVVPVGAVGQLEEWFQQQTHPCCTWYNHRHHNALILIIAATLTTSSDESGDLSIKVSPSSVS